MAKGYNHRVVMSPQPDHQVFVSWQKIAATVEKLAVAIRKDYRGQHPRLIGILKGSFMFMADLIRLLDFPLEVDFIRLSSYGRDTESAGKVKVVQSLRSPVRGRAVLVIEDIVDTGLTVAFLLDYLRRKKPASLKLCALADKPLEIVVEKLNKLKQVVVDLGTTLSSPLSTLSFMALPVIPELRLTDLGLVDVGQFRVIR